MNTKFSASLKIDGVKYNAFEIENEADFDKLDLSVPRGKIPSTLYKQTTLTFNPWSETHWLKKRFFDKYFNLRLCSFVF